MNYTYTLNGDLHKFSDDRHIECVVAYRIGRMYKPHKRCESFAEAMKQRVVTARLKGYAIIVDVKKEEE